MISKSQKAKVEKALKNHKLFSGHYFWSNPYSASSRRYMEQRDNWRVAFKYQGNHYEYQSVVTRACKNVYYRGIFSINGNQKTVTLFKNLMK